MVFVKTRGRISSGKWKMEKTSWPSKIWARWNEWFDRTKSKIPSYSFWKNSRGSYFSNLLVQWLQSKSHLKWSIAARNFRGFLIRTGRKSDPNWIFKTKFYRQHTVKDVNNQWQKALAMLSSILNQIYCWKKEI